jgi:hypothetical protein
MAKIGRNQPCTCGSGKKYKGCCGVKMQRIYAAARVNHHRVNEAVNDLKSGAITLEDFEALISELVKSNPYAPGHEEHQPLLGAV